jgi:AraC-like DNA-binding protein
MGVIILCAICNLVTFYRSKSTIAERQQQLSEVVLKQVNERINENMVQLENVREELLNNSNFTSLNKAKFNDYSSFIYKQYLLYLDLNIYRKMNNTYSNIILYFEKDNKIVASNSVNTSDGYWKIYHKELDISYEQWKALLSRDYEKFSLKNLYISKTEMLVFARTIQQNQADRQKVNLFVTYTKDDLENLIGGYQYNQSTSIILLNEMDYSAIKFDTASLLNDKDDEQKVIDAIISNKEEVCLKNNETVHINYLRNDMLGPFYLLTPDSIYLEAIKNTRTIFILTFFVTIAFSLILIYVFIKNNYKPIRDLLQALKADVKIASGNQNEYAAVQEGVVRVKAEYRNINGALRRQSSLLQKIYLSRILSGGTVELSDKELKEIYDISFMGNEFAVIIFYIEEFLSDTKHVKEEMDKLEQAQFILTNVFREIADKEEITVYQTNMDALSVLILNLPSNSEVKSKLSSILKREHEFIACHYNMEYTTAISNIHNEFRELPLAYQEALQALEAKRLYDMDDTVYYQDILQLAGSSYHYNYEEELDLIHYIQKNNVESAKRLFHEVIKSNLSCKKFLSHDIMRCLMFDLLGTALKSFDGEEKSQLFIKNLKPAKRLSECKNLQEMIKLYDDILDSCCEFFMEEAGGDGNESLCVQIQDYIKVNYSDCNLCVTSIAEAFSLSPVAMSKMFREITGNKLLVYVAEVRINTAKRLLLQNASSLSDIASEVGFGSTKTFTRVFKQMVGCTPGQWRDSLEMTEI